MTTLADLFADYRPRSAEESIDVERMRALAETHDPWSRTVELHATASALIVDAASGRVLLRWHVRQHGWLQVGGHGDPGETDPLAIAVREATEETGLNDLTPWQAVPIHLVIVPVPANHREPAHEHADIRFVFRTDHPERARPESPDAPITWLSVADAIDATTEDNLRETLTRLAALSDR